MYPATYTYAPEKMHKNDLVVQYAAGKARWLHKLFMPPDKVGPPRLQEYNLLSSNRSISDPIQSPIVYVTLPLYLLSSSSSLLFSIYYPPHPHFFGNISGRSAPNQHQIEIICAFYSLVNLLFN